VSLGAWAPIDVGAIDLRLGFAWPEFLLRFTRATAHAGSEAPAEWMALQLGLSVLGVRLTLGDAVFLEVRAGELSAQVTYLPGSGLQGLQVGYGIDWAPTFRAGVAF
jgi:hypothetical protein